MTLDSPRVSNALLLAATATLLLLGLRHFEPGYPPSARPDVLSDWAIATGPASAVISVLAVASTILALWALVVALLTLIVALTRHRETARLWVRATPPALRRGLGVTTIVVATGAPVTGVSAAEPPPTLSDVGPADPAATGVAVPVLTDLGAVAAVPEPDDIRLADPDVRDPAPDAIDAAADVWHVVPGDHLWHIAEETVRDHGGDPTDAVVAAYWRRLIDANEGEIGADPDLIHPGQVVRLPRIE